MIEEIRALEQRQPNRDIASNEFVLTFNDDDS